MQHLHPNLTTWHISFGTYGARLHGGPRPTVELSRNRPGEEFVAPDPVRELGERRAMRGVPIFLTVQQQRFVQGRIPEICRRGGWELRTCAASPDHVHVLCDVPPPIHGERVRRLIKRWLGQALDERWTRGAALTWWAEQGSNKAVRDERYLNNAYNYILGQRAEGREGERGNA